MTLPLTTHKPYLEDRWQDQVDLEMEMLKAGRELVEARIDKARRKGQMDRLRPHRTLIKDFIEPVSESLQEWKVKVRAQRGPKPIALQYLDLLPADVAALVSLRAVFRRLGHETRTILPIAYEIGSSIEHEAQMEAWIANDPEGFEGLRRYYLKRGSNAAHIKRASVSVFRKHVADKVGYEDWGSEVRRRVGLQMIDCIVQATGRFRVIADRSVAKYGSKPSAWPMVLQPDPELLDWLKNAMDDEAVHQPVYMPTLIKPKPWEGPKDGGYWTPFVKPPFFIRFKASHETQRQRAIDEYMALDMPQVYEAINFIQETPWRINRRVFEVAQEMWEKDLALAGMPRKEAERVPPRPDDWEENKEGFERWRKQAGDINTRNAKTVSKFLATDRAIKLARKFLNEPRFYFPHMLDFRGRMYPIPSDLSPQGHDLHRGLLEFAEGKPVGEDGAQWLAIQVANCFGVDKVSYQDRLDWVAERKAQWLAIAEDPIENRHWVEADDPWQALAAVLDLVGFYSEGAAYVSHAPIRVDGTCNGIQHLSAMVRDEEGGASVNLLEAESPRDIYQEVADTLTDVLKQEAEAGEKYAEDWLECFGGRAPRSVTKRPVMILPYGGKMSAYMKYTHEWLDENDPVGVYIADKDRGKAVGYLTSKLWDAVSARLEKAQEVMRWLQGCSKIASKSGLPIYWVTPSGFVVRHFYGEVERKCITTNIDGQRIVLEGRDIKATLDPKAQAQGIAPNFVHSMDASAMMICAVLCKDNEVSSLTTIHDSYGTHAADMWKLYSCIREGFIETYRSDVLGEFLQACKNVMPEASGWQDQPEAGSLDIEAVRFSDYFFA